MLYYAVLFVGMFEPKEFTNLLDAFEFVAENRKQHSFLIKDARNGSWKDGAELFKGMQRLFAPIDSDEDED